MQSMLRRATTFLTPASSSTDLSSAGSNAEFTKARTTTALFPTVSPDVDGEDCDHDCASCTISYPKKFSIDESDALYGHVKQWSTHMLVATGKSDWVRDVADEKGSVMEAVGKFGMHLRNGKLMLSASNMPLPDEADVMAENPAEVATTILLLPAWKIVEGVRPKDVPELLTEVVERAPTTTTPITVASKEEERAPSHAVPTALATPPAEPTTESDPPTEPTPTSTDLAASLSAATANLTFTHSFKTRACPHRALILLCSQKTRDARCGQSAPLLRREFERHLRARGLYRDLHDQRPGGVGIYFISHVGGHKYAANVMVYRRGVGSWDPSASVVATAAEEDAEEGKDEEVGASQGIWLARVRPEDCENIVRFTVLQGKVVKPDRQLRGGFDRQRGLVSW